MQGQLWLSINSPHAVHHALFAGSSSCRGQVTLGSRPGSKGQLGVCVSLCVYLSLCWI